MIDPLSLSEMLRTIVVLGGLLLSGWALIDDLWDLVTVRRFGEVGGPRWVLAVEHIWFNATLLAGWLFFLGVLSVAISLPPRTDVEQNAWARIASWLNVGFGCAVLLAQAVRRAGRIRIRALPLSAWERMLASMVDGLSVEDRAALLGRLLVATTAGRQMGHLIANSLAAPVGLIDLVLETATLTDEQRADLIEAREHILGVSTRAAGLHQEIKDQEHLS